MRDECHDKELGNGGKVYDVMLLPQIRSSTHLQAPPTNHVAKISKWRKVFLLLLRLLLAFLWSF